MTLLDYVYKCIKEDKGIENIKKNFTFEEYVDAIIRDYQYETEFEDREWGYMSYIEDVLKEWWKENEKQTVE